MVKYAIIGLGNMGSGHTENFLNGRVKDAVITAVADTDPKKTENYKQKFEGKFLQQPIYYESGEKLLDSAQVDAVIIAVPHYQHTELSIKALKRGINVICEKPAGVYTKQVKEMNEAAKKSDALFTMMFNQRTNCVYRKMREMILGGELGEIRRVNWIITDWYRAQCYYDSSEWRATWKGEGGGVLFNQCPHQLDLLQWITGIMPKSIRAFCKYGKWHNIEVEDDVTAYIEFENGATGVFITTTADAPGTNRLEVTGDLGKIVCENNKIDFYKLEMSEREFNSTYTGGFGSPKCEKIEVQTDGKNEQHVGIINNFTDAILKRDKLFVEGTEGLKGVEIMNAMSMSGWLDGECVQIPVDEDKYLELLNQKIASSKFTKTVKETVLDTKGTY